MKKFDEAFPETRVAMEKLEEAIEKMLSGDISHEEAQNAIRDANHIISEARDKIEAMRHKPSANW
jgi:predicted RNA-binding protein associated with RNAse of E/G family